MSTPIGILISSFDYSPVAEDEFHDWYDTEHIPERARIPGFLQCRRWLSVDEPKVSVTTYELASVAVLRSPGYLAVGYENNSPWTRRVGWRCIKRLRIEGEQISPGNRLPCEQAIGLLVIATNVEPAYEAALEHWYDHEYLSDLARIPGVGCVRRFRATNGTHNHVITCHLDRLNVATSKAWNEATRTPSARRIEPHLRDYSRTSCARYDRAPTD